MKQIEENAEQFVNLLEKVHEMEGSLKEMVISLLKSKTKVCPKPKDKKLR